MRVNARAFACAFFRMNRGDETGKKFGAGDGDRTRDIQLGKLAFYR